MEQIKEKLKERIERIITIDLTRGRLEGGLEAMDYDEIATFIVNKHSEIDLTIDKIIVDSDKNNNLDELKDMGDFQIARYMYKFITTNDQPECEPYW
jgi:hypothetical protein